MSRHLIYNEKKLRHISTDVYFDDYKEIQEAFDVMHTKLNKYPLMIGLSAPQIGIQKRLISLQGRSVVGGKLEVKDFINPIIVEKKQIHLVREKYTSVDPITKEKTQTEYFVRRYGNILIEYIDNRLQQNRVRLTPPSSYIFQTLMDYLDGILVPDVGVPVLEGFDEASDETKQQILKMCDDALIQREQSINDYIATDPESQDILNKARFARDVEAGKIKYTREETPRDDLTTEEILGEEKK